MNNKERKELLQQKENWHTFANLLSRAINDMNCVNRFDEVCEVLVNFIHLSKQLFRNTDKKISSIVAKLEEFLDNAQQQMDGIEKKSKPLIQQAVSLYNAEYQGDLSFDGDIDKWFNRTFPLMVLYVNKKMKAGD